MSVRSKRVTDSPTSGRNNQMLVIGGIVGAVLLIVVMALIGRGLGGGTVNTAEAEYDAQGRFIGAETATLVIEEYADFSCPHCKEASQTLTPNIIRDYVDTDQVRFHYIPVALNNFGDPSLFAAQGALCAEKQGRFWSYHDRLFERQNIDQFSIANLTNFAGDVGLDEGAFRSCLTSGEFRAQVEQNNQNFAQLYERGATGTPTYVIGTQVVGGVVPYEQLKAAIDAQLGATTQSQ